MARKNNNKNSTNTSAESSAVANVNVTSAHQQLPDYVPIDFSEPPKHLEVINKKMRAIKKKLRKISEAEAAIAAGSKKVTSEQRSSLLTKDALERNLRDLEEIKSSVDEVDFSAQLRLVCCARICPLSSCSSTDDVASLFSLFSCWVFSSLHSTPLQSL